MTAALGGIDLRLLGPACARRDGVEIALGSSRRAAVLSVLALHANHAVSRDRLVGEVWGDDPPASATDTVYTYVSTLRRALEPGRDRWSAGGILTSGSGSYSLRVDEQAVDVFRFEALRERGKRHRAAGDHPAECAALEAALGLWRGEALSGIPGPFAEAQRLRLGELRLATMERHAALLVELGRRDEAIAVLRALVAEHPLKERLHAMLMGALHAGGRTLEALGVHDHVRDLLVEELGTEPSADLRTVRGRILADVGGAPAAGDPAPLAGRDAELDILRRAIAGVAAGRGGSVRFEGAPGMGKSALLRAALRRPVPPGCRVAHGGGDEASRHTTLGVLLECLQSTGASRALAREIYVLSGADPIDRAVAAVRAAAAAAPLILVVDDLQWVDPVSLRVWQALHPLTRELPLLLVAAARSGSGGMVAVPADVVVELPALPPDAARALVDAASPERRDTRETDRILRSAGGNPCYLRHLARSGPGGDGDAGTLPPDLIAAVHAHLAGLPEPTRQLLTAVSFLGEPCSVAELAVVTGRPAGELLPGVAAARAAGVLTGPGRQLRFRHPVVGRALHDGTPVALRTMLRRSFAERIAEAGGSPRRVVAQLLAGRVPLDEGTSRWLAAHLPELADHAPEAALDLLRRARAQPGLSEPARLMLMPWLARLLFGQEHNAVAEAAWVAARATTPELRAEMLWVVACCHELYGEPAAAAEIARSVLSGGDLPEHWLDLFRMMLLLRPASVRRPGAMVPAS